MKSAKPDTFLVVCLNPVLQKTIILAGLKKNEVNRTAKWRIDTAGKGVCCARVLGQSGFDALHLTQLGGPTRDWFTAMCAADEVTLRWVDSGSDIRFCTTLIDEMDGTVTEIVEEARPVEAHTGDRLLAEFSRTLPEESAVMLSGTKAAGFPPGIMGAMASMAAEAGKKLFLDLKGRDLLDCLPARPLVVKPNLEELLQTYPSASDLPAGGKAVDEAAVRGLVQKIGKEYYSHWGSYLVVTRGSLPTLYWDGVVLRECPIVQVEALNPIGSGDAFNAGVASSLCSGATIAEAVAEGTRLGALNAENLKPGSIFGEENA